MGKGVKCCLYLKVDNVGKQALRDAICAMNRGEERRDSFEAERGEQWGEQCGWMGADWWYSVHRQCEREAQLSSQTQQTMGKHHPIITCLLS